MVWPAHLPIRAERRVARSLAATANNGTLCFRPGTSAAILANHRSADTTTTRWRRAARGEDHSRGVVHRRETHSFVAS